MCFLSPCTVFHSVSLASSTVFFGLLFTILLELLLCFAAFHSVLDPEENLKVFSVYWLMCVFSVPKENPCSSEQLIHTSASFSLPCSLILGVLRSSHLKVLRSLLIFLSGF